MMRCADHTEALMDRPVSMGDRPDPILRDQIFNNADSFAQTFDEAWQEHSLSDPEHGLENEAKLPLILERVSDHPFLKENPEMARQVAEFRLRLLGL
jgi:hypothetical protein